MKVFKFLGRGIGHEDTDKGCQDRLSSLITKDGKHINVISDGCSSSEYATETAQDNIDEITNIFSCLSIKELSRDSLAGLYPELAKPFSTFNKDDITSCLDLIFKYKPFALSQKMNLSNPRMSDFCATLLFVVVEDEQTMIGHIGDGNIILFNKDGEIVYHSKEDNGKDSTHTYFTISNNFSEHFHYDIIPTESFHSLIMFSDGPQTMFKLEGNGVIAKGAYEIVVEPVTNNQIKTEEELTKRLQKYLANAMHYGFDDWSIIVAAKQEENIPNISPISLKQLFMETYKNNSDVTEEIDKISFEKSNDVHKPFEKSNEIDEPAEATDEYSQNSNAKASEKENQKNIVLKLRCKFEEFFTKLHRIIFRKRKNTNQLKKGDCHE